MSLVKFPDLLSKLVKNYDQSFWNGDGTVDLKLTDLGKLIEADPRMTVAGLKSRWETENPLKKGYIGSGIDFNVDKTVPLRLGEPNGSNTGFSLRLNTRADIDAMLHMVLSQEGIASLEDEKLQNIREILTKYVSMEEQGALVVLSLLGNASLGAGGNATTPFSPAVNTGFSFKGSGNYQWFYCRPAAQKEELFEAIGTTFSRSRLPQTPLTEVQKAGLPIFLEQNELLYSSYAGFLDFSAHVGVGYTFSGTKNYSLGQLDLATKLEVQATTRLDMGYRLGGAFEILALSGDDADWLRVVVKKNHHANFNYALGVSVDTRLSTPDLPDGGMEMMGAILGLNTAQILEKTLEYAEMPPKSILKCLDGFSRALIEKYTGKALAKIKKSKLNDELKKVFSAMQKAVETLRSLDDQLVGLYERFLGRIDFSDALGKIRGVLDLTDAEAQKRKLLEEANLSPLLKDFIGQLLGQAFSTLILRYSDFHGELETRVNRFRQLVTGDAEQDVRAFVRARLDALNLEKLADTLAKCDTPEKLADQANTAVDGLVERLVGKSVHEVLKDTHVVKLVEEVNGFALNFKGTVNKIGARVRDALNARGRFQLSDAYQNAREEDRLIDIQVRVRSEGNADEKGMVLYGQATSGNFAEVFKDENIGLVKVNRAEFTDRATRTQTLNINIFGWNYRDVSSLFSELNTSVRVGADGHVTVYGLSVDGKRITEGRKRGTKLNYMLRLGGRLEGAFTSPGDLKKQTVDAFKALGNLWNSFDYEIKDKATSLDELTAYLEPGVKMGIIDEKRKQSLIEEIKNVRFQPTDSADKLGRVEVKYSYQFDGDALGTALTSDYSGHFGFSGKDANQRALEKIFLDRLLACYYIPGDPPRVNKVAALYYDGIFSAFKKNPNLPLKKYCKDIRLKVDNQPVKVKTGITDVAWAQSLYFSNVWFADFLDDFRLHADAAPQIKLEKLEKFLKNFVKQLKEMGKGSKQLRSLPFLVLERMVHLSSGGTKSCRSFMEINVYDKNGEDKRFSISITG